MQIFVNGRFLVGEEHRRLTEERSTEDKLLMTSCCWKKDAETEARRVFLEDTGGWGSVEAGVELKMML
jgi:hypothetical protein